ncbi:MAG: hypothetical protein LBC02_04860 [Planctomycetaceae bacterium]|jgi:hypothetical protein|nr:hypothetical protein [Planctomycetaceae bacterium]
MGRQTPNHKPQTTNPKKIKIGLDKSTEISDDSPPNQKTLLCFLHFHVFTFRSTGFVKTGTIGQSLKHKP